MVDSNCTETLEKQTSSNSFLLEYFKIWLPPFLLSTLLELYSILFEGDSQSHELWWMSPGDNGVMAHGRLPLMGTAKASSCLSAVPG